MRDGKITISRPTYSNGKKAIVISVIDESISAGFLNVEIGYEEFTLALTGQGHVPCQFELRNPDRVGKRREHKTERILVPRTLPYARPGKRALAARPILAPFEVDGWIGNVDDLFNSNKRERDGENRFQQVGFDRYVDPPQE